MLSILAATDCRGFAGYCEGTKKTKRTQRKRGLKTKYNGIELEPITEPQIFDPPKEMLVWDSSSTLPRIRVVCAVTTRNFYQVVTLDSYYEYCAEIPEEPKPKRATNIQLMEWLAKGNGMWKRKNDSSVIIYASFFEDSIEKEVEDFVLIRPFGTDKWLEPTLENMGMVNHEQEEEDE